MTQNQVEKPASRRVFYGGLFLLNVIFALDIVIDWGALSGTLYLLLVPLALWGGKLKYLFLFTAFATIYMFFECIVLAHDGNIARHVLNHALAFGWLWLSVAGVLLNKRHSS